MYDQVGDAAQAVGPKCGNVEQQTEADRREPDAGRHAESRGNLGQRAEGRSFSGGEQQGFHTGLFFFRENNGDNVEDQHTGAQHQYAKRVRKETPPAVVLQAERHAGCFVIPAQFGFTKRDGFCGGPVIILAVVIAVRSILHDEMIEEIVFLPAVVVRRSLWKAVFLDDALCFFIGQHSFEFFRDLAVHLNGAQSRVGSAVDDAVRILQLLVEEKQADQQDKKKACQKRFPVT